VRTRALAAAGLIVLAVACRGEQEPLRSRVEGVRAASTVSLDTWCDASWAGDAGPTLTLPTVEAARAGGTVPPWSTEGRVWVNLWATWCLPCRREMPLILRLAERLGSEGRPVDLWFVSLDESADDLTRFLSENPEIAPGASVRVVSPAELGTWMAGFTQAPTSSIPINLMVAPGGHLRCVRVGSLRDGDYPLVKAIFE